MLSRWLAKFFFQNALWSYWKAGMAGIVRFAGLFKSPWARSDFPGIMEAGMEVPPMTRTEAIKEFFKQAVLPVAIAGLLYCIFKSACIRHGDDRKRVVWDT